jgi:imidazolonepropionase-like amidohydrolase
MRPIDPRSAGGSARRAAAWLAALVLAAGSVEAHDQIPAPPQSRPVLLRGGDLYTVSAGVLPRTDLLIETGRIARIGAALEPPPGAEIVDVSGRRVYPGLIALGTSLGLIEIGAVRATDDRAEVGDVTPEAAAHVAYNPDSELIPTVRSQGIATAQVFPVGGLVAGRPFLTRLDGWTKEDSAVRLHDGLFVRWPRLAVDRRPSAKSKIEEREKKIEEQRSLLLRTFGQALAYDRARQAHADLEIDVRLEAMRAVVRGEEPLYVQADDARQIVEAVEFAAERELPLVIVGGREAHRVAGLLARHDVPVIVGSIAALPLRADDPYDDAYRLPAVLHEAGVRFAIAHATDDSWDVRNLSFHAGLAVAFGLPADEALRAITLSAAEIAGVDGDLGSLEVGKEATLFVSEGDVLDVIGRKVTHLFVAGRRVDLDDRHKELYRKYRGRGDHR